MMGVGMQRRSEGYADLLQRRRNAHARTRTHTRTPAHPHTRAHTHTYIPTYPVVHACAYPEPQGCEPAHGGMEVSEPPKVGKIMARTCKRLVFYGRSWFRYIPLPSFATYPVGRVLKDIGLRLWGVQGLGFRV